MWIKLRTKLRMCFRGMICRPYWAAGNWSETANKWWMTGEGIKYQEIQRIIIQCLECGEGMSAGLLAIHRQTQHGVESGGRMQWETPPPYGEPQTYHMAYPNARGPRKFPVKGCRGWSETRTAMRDNFLHMHVRYTEIILEEGNLLQPRCPRRGILVTCKALNGRHVTTA